MHELSATWTEQDITGAIRAWKGNKSPGPDGYTGEFYNSFLEVILLDLKEVFTTINQSQTSLHPLNDSYIVLIPKKEAANLPQDFRPISLVNGIQKIYSRIMAYKLKPLLQRLLSSNQTGFLKSRSILHGFQYAQEIIHSATKQKIQVAILKADIYKAFDTLDWNFLLSSLHARGFPQNWIDSVRYRVLLGNSKVVLNAVAGKSITLKRGVRQGDPISPYLFNLAVDFLIRWNEKLTQLNFLAPPFPRCRSCLLYADDTLLFIKPTANQILKTGLILTLFGHLSGLMVNMLKSELSVTSSTPFLTQRLAAIVQCRSASFPIKYLGLPLSHKKLTKVDYIPLIDRIQAKLTGWKAPLLSVGGRIILVNSVLTAMPQFFMSMFLLPRWVLRAIDKIRRNFLWHGHKDQHANTKRLFMVNWQLVTRPKDLGGLGVRNLLITNQSLLAKWIWLWYDSNCSWWKEATPTEHESAKPWYNPQRSSFWKAIASVAPAFQCSVKHHIGNGNITQFWHDNWLGAPLKILFPDLFQAAQNQHCSVQQQTDETGWLLEFSDLTPTAQLQKDQLLAQLLQFPMSSSQDQLQWLRNGTSFTVRSLYNFLSHVPSPTSTLKAIWAIKAPLRVMIFAWLMMINRLATIDNLKRRGWHLPNMCVMCKAQEESVTHLFHTCLIATQIRAYIHDTFSAQLAVPEKYTTDSSFQMLTDSKENSDARKLELTTCFVLWRERCRRIFADKTTDQLSMVREIRTEYDTWFTHAHNGLPTVPHSE